jgi:hypothetical protein
MENGAAQAKSEDQNIHGVFQYKTGAYFLEVGAADSDVTPCFQQMLGIGALVLDSFGVFNLTLVTMMAHRNGVGPRIPS